VDGLANASIPRETIDPADPEETHDHYLVIDRNVFGNDLQTHEEVTRAFMARWHLPPYLRPVFTGLPNEMALLTYGNYIAIQRSLYAQTPDTTVAEPAAAITTPARILPEKRSPRRKSDRKQGVTSSSSPKESRAQIAANAVSSGLVTQREATDLFRP